MSTRSETNQLFSMGIVPGKHIWANTNVSTGDGSEAWPYRLLSEAAADIRNGLGDAIVMTSSPSTSWREAPVVIVQKTNFAIFWKAPSLGIAEPSGVGSDVANAVCEFIDPGGMTRISGIEFQCTTIAVHNLTVGQVVLFGGVTQTGANYINGMHRVQSTPSTTTFNCRITGGTLDAAQEPFLSDTGFGIGFVMPLVLDRCAEVYLSGVVFDAQLLSLGWSGLAITDAVGTVAGSKDIEVVGGKFKKAALGFQDIADVPGLVGAGGGMLVERVTFGPALLTPFNDHAINTGIGCLYLSHGQDFSITRCRVEYDSNSPNPFQGPEPWVPEGLVQWTSRNQPSLGLLYALNRHPIPTGKTGIQRDRIYKNWAENQESLGDRQFPKRNFFADITVIQDVTMDVDGFFVDREPQTIIGQEALSTQSDLIHERDVA
ncbi:hypothetical protein LCGC14_2561360, partial [marine sediment metagenome]